MSPELSLTSFGFTDLEAQLYCALLRSAPASGYRLAKLVGKAPANTYQALASLVQKGAAMVEEGTTRAFRPIPPEELFNRLQGDFEQRRQRAQTLLAGVTRSPERDGIFQIREVAALYARAAEMIERADDIILFDLFPLPFTKLAPLLRAAATRGVRIAGIVYEASLEPEPFTAVRAESSHVIGRWPGAQLSLVADGEEHLVALLSFSDDIVLHGAWSESAYLSCLQHNGLASEIRLLDAFPEDGDRLQDIALLRALPPGIRSMHGAPRRAELAEPER